VSPPSAVSPIAGKIQGWGEIPLVAKSRGPNSNALALTESAALT